MAASASDEENKELQRLAADGLPRETRIWVTHFFSHFGSTKGQRHAFREAVRDAGFGTPGPHTEIGSDEEVTGDGYWHHWAHTVFMADPDALRGASARAQTLATEHGVGYNAWAVQRVDHRDGPPRIAN
jgi:hypothetical protein